jgi:hypothetical protein
VKCRRCGKEFGPGDKVIKTLPKANSETASFFCPDHFYSESVRLTGKRRIRKIIRDKACSRLEAINKKSGKKRLRPFHQ